jgi:hypothetical protein
MNIKYQSPNYKPEAITDRYLHIDLQTNKPVVEETIKTSKTNYTYKSYELPEELYNAYSECIAEAEKIKTMFPYCVTFKENTQCQL